MPPEPTKQPITTGRVVLVHSRKFKHGPYPGLVVAAFAGTPYVNVNPSVDGANDGEALKEFRDSGQGNTFTSLPVFDPLTPEQRAELPESMVAWCEWMPVQAQGGGFADRIAKLESQAAQAERGGFTHTERLDTIDRRLSAIEAKLSEPRGAGEPSPNVAAELHNLRQAVETLATHLCNDGSDIRNRVQEILRV
jgi:hypothetical protein